MKFTFDHLQFRDIPFDADDDRSASGYYGYKWAEVLEADAFSLFEEKGIFSPEVAASFRDNILSKGGTEDPMELYVRFRGHKPETKALIEKMQLGK